MSTPDSECIVDVSRTWTYAQTAVAIEQQSAAFVEAGVQAGDRVGVHFNKSAEGFIAMHAVVSAGAVAVPLDPASPPARLARICEQMQISVVSSHAPRKRSLEALHAQSPLRTVVGTGIELEGCDFVAAEALAAFEPRPPVATSHDDLAYIVTTSGSTGEPKGICHTHASGRAYVDMTVQAFGLNPTDRVADIAPHHFDISTFSLWATPRAGATNVIVNEAYQRLPASHSQLLADEGVTVWYSVPFLIQQLVLRGDLANRNLDALRWVHFGGETIPAEIVASMMGHCPNARFANIYGPAETNHITHAVFDVPPEAGKLLPVGVSVAGVTIRIVSPGSDVSASDSLVAPREIGEMWAATPQLMAGYWDGEEVDEASIQMIDGVRFYGTGDLMSRDDAGELTFHGRADQQVKVRGFRIELEGIEVELETMVREMGSAENVVVSVHRRSTGEDELVAGILGPTTSFDEATFIQQAASLMPAYAVPTKTVPIESPALTGSGKLDRRTLREQTVRLAEDSS